MSNFPWDWYWEADDGRIYGSARQTTVDAEDGALSEWLSGGLNPTPWPRGAEGDQTDQALQAVLSPYGLRVTPLTLPEIKTILKDEIDQEAESVRKQFITSGSGQAMTYQQKADEALAYHNGPDRNPEHYPLLSAEVGITADSLDGVSQVVLASFRLWQGIGAVIESERLRAKKHIDEADTESQARSARAHVAWPVM